MCCFLKIFNSVVNMVVMGLVLGQSLMVVPIECYPPMSSSQYCEVCCCLHIK